MIERVMSWALALTLAALLLFEVWQALLWLTPNAVFGLIALRSGISFFEPGMRYITAGLELIAVFLLLWPAMRVRGAQLALLVVLGAIAFHLSPWLGIAVPRPDIVSPMLAHGYSAAELDSFHLPTDHGAMFLLALAIAGLSVGLIFVERAKVKVMAPHGRRPAGVFA
jgi:hypothetical protein